MKLIPKSAVPDEARRVFGSKCDFALVDFGPNFPEWYDPKTCKGFGAVGYHQYFTDTRISNAFDNVGEEEKIKWDSLKKWLIIGGAALIFVFVVMRFL